MYEELVKRLRDDEAWKNCDFDFIYGWMHEAADAIEVLSKMEKTTRWIPVTERLPKAERKSYWVCTDTGYQCECRWTNDRFGIRESDEFGWKIFDIPQYQKVVAWMSLPCPYEPPHGRLIDADALDTSILQAGFSYAITRRKLRYTPGEVREKIANAPTIIPAEEGE